jgi:hypothetical protein
MAVLGVGLTILIISMARAGWEIWASDNNGEIQGNNLVNFTAVFGDGTTTPGTYKLPEAGMLPDNMFYGMKKIRDSLWLAFSQGIAKTRMALLLADKSIAESKKMMDVGKYDLTIEAGNEAMNKLEYADKLINDVKVADAQTKQLHYQIFWAGYAYKEVLDKMQDAFDLDTGKYSQLINRINDWNKTEEQNRYNWDY